MSATDYTNFHRLASFALIGLKKALTKLTPMHYPWIYR